MKTLIVIIAMSVKIIIPTNCQAADLSDSGPANELIRLCFEYRDQRKPEVLLRIEQHLLAHPDDSAKTVHSLKVSPATIAMAVKLVDEAPAGAKWKQTLLVWFGFTKPTPELFQLLFRVAFDKRETEATRNEARRQLLANADESSFPIVAEMLGRLDSRRELLEAIDWAIGGKLLAVADLGLSVHDSLHSGIKLDPSAAEQLKVMRENLTRLKQEIVGTGGAKARKAVALREVEKRFWADLFAQKPVPEAEALDKLHNYARLALLERLGLVFGILNGGSGRSAEVRRLAETHIWQEENALVRRYLLDVIVAPMSKDDRIKYLRFAHEREANEGLRAQIGMMLELHERVLPK